LAIGYGDVVDVLVQKRKDKKAAERFFKKLMKGQGHSAREIVSDKLPKSDRLLVTVRREKQSCPLQCIAMSAMQIIVLRYRMKPRERKSDRCEGSSHLARCNDSWPFTVRFTISFVSADISIGLPTTDC
jgi:transposase-like protein